MKSFKKCFRLVAFNKPDMKSFDTDYFLVAADDAEEAIKIFKSQAPDFFGVKEVVESFPIVNSENNQTLPQPEDLLIPGMVLSGKLNG